MRRTYWAVLWPTLDILSRGGSKQTGPQPQSEKLVGVPCPGLCGDAPRAAGRPVGRLQAPIAALYPSQLLRETSN